jgi:hypothetical protein
MSQQAKNPASPTLGREPAQTREQPVATQPEGSSPRAPRVGSGELYRALAEVKGQAQFLLYLADQIEDSLHQLTDESGPDHNAFLCKILGMYSSQLESKHQGLGDKIAETCQELYVAVREFDLV